METSTENIKKEPPNYSVEIKEFAENAMNELLGWYGYDQENEEDETESRQYNRSGDSSGPECSDSNGGSGNTSRNTLDEKRCGWCNKSLSGIGQTTGAFCSELCFSQSRRASFKRNRTCDWCRTVRHSVAHVDVRDGARQLQFCSDKCLTQYKMLIFFRETRTHLKLQPHFKLPTVDTDTVLITPDMWLKDYQNTTTATSPTPTSLAPPLSVPTAPRAVPPATSIPSLSLQSSPQPRRRFRRTTTQNMDAPEDLRVRPRTPVERKDTSEETHANWPPPLPPVTILVPYPIVVPVPLPIPIPIPIPVPENIFFTATSTASTNISTTTTTTVTTATTTITTAINSTHVTTSSNTSASNSETVTFKPNVLTTNEEILNQKSTTSTNRRILRARKRPSTKELSSNNVPA